MLVAQRRTAVMALALLVCLSLARSAAAAEITVRARTALSLEVGHHGRAVRVTGELRDNIYRGLPGRTIRLAITRARPPEAGGAAGEPGGERGAVDAEGRSVTDAMEADLVRYIATDRNGRFQLTDLRGDGLWLVTVVFEGDALLEASRAEALLDVRREPVDITVELPVAAPVWVPLPIALAVTSDGEPVPGQVLEISVAGEATQTSVVTDTSGRYRGELAEFHGVGEVPLDVVFAGDTIYQPTRVTETVFLYRAGELSLAAEAADTREARLLVISGRLDSEQGPIAGVPVTVRAERAGPGHRAVFGSETRVTDARGAFELIRQLDRDLPGGSYRAVAAFDPLAQPDPELRLETTASFTLLSPPGVRLGRIARTAAGLLAGAILAGLVAIRVTSRRRAKRRVKVVPKPGAEAPERLYEFSVPPPDAPAARDRVAGRVLDADSGEPLDRGSLRAVHQETERTFPVATDGAFCTEPLAPGKHELFFESPGYVTTRLQVSIPHRGRHGHVDVYLVSVRAWVRYLYQELTQRLELGEGSDGVWGRQTPRQIEQLLLEAVAVVKPRARYPARFEGFRRELLAVLDDPAVLPADRLLRALTLLVEEVYYSGRIYAEDMVSLCRSLIEGVETIVGD